MRLNMILDCTLRDGGYYTSWDFDKKLVDNYLYAINKLPINIIEVGYRSESKKDYLGEYYYCPNHVLKYLRKYCNKKIAIMFNEKDVNPGMAAELLEGCDMIDIVRGETAAVMIKDQAKSTAGVKSAIDGLIERIPSEVGPA